MCSLPSALALAPHLKSRDAPLALAVASAGQLTKTSDVLGARITPGAYFSIGRAEASEVPAGLACLLPSKSPRSRASFGCRGVRVRQSGLVKTRIGAVQPTRHSTRPRTIAAPFCGASTGRSHSSTELCAMRNAVSVRNRACVASECSARRDTQQHVRFAPPRTHLFPNQARQNAPLRFWKRCHDLRKASISQHVTSRASSRGRPLHKELAGRQSG